jgi:DNA end-binding protein Ku
MPSSKRVSGQRPIASATISFGLVAIPVKLYSAAVATERIAFHWVRKSDGSRVEERYRATKDGKPVERADMAKAYEFAPGKHVVFTPDELKVLEEASSQSLDVLEFVPLESVDPMYFAATYYLLPDKGGAKPYALLATALAEEQRCAVGKWTFRGKEHIVVVRTVQQGLALHHLHFRAELRALKDLGYEPTKVSAPEVKLARQLISHLAVQKFDANEFVDEHRARVKAAIDKKIQGKEIELETPVEGRRDNVINLMDALKASLASRSDTSTAGRKAPRKRSGPARRKPA